MNALAECDDSDRADREGFKDAGHISELLTFRLARLVAVNDKAGGRWMKSNFGINLNDWRVLGLVHEFGPVRVGLIADILLLDRGQVTRIVQGLVTRDLLKTNAGKEDGRSVELTLTDAGERIHQQTMSFASDRNKLVVAPLSEQETTQFLDILDKLTEHNEDLLNLPDPGK